MTDRAEWLAALQVGDKVAIPGRWSNAGRVLAVDRLTATQIILANGTRFRRDTGRAVGSADGWNVAFLQPFSQEFADKVERERLYEWLNGLQRKRDLPLEALRAMKAAHDEATKEQP